VREIGAALARVAMGTVMGIGDQWTNVIRRFWMMRHSPQREAACNVQDFAAFTQPP